MNSMTVSISHILFIPSIYGLVRYFKVDFSCCIKKGSIMACAGSEDSDNLDQSHSLKSPVSFKHVKSHDKLTQLDLIR